MSRRLLALALLAGLLSGCARRPAAPDPAPRVAQSWPGAPVLALAEVRSDTTRQLLAVGADGASHWVGQPDRPGPQLPAGIVRLIVTDLAPGAAPALVLGTAGRVAAYDLDGRLLWDYPTGGAAVTSLVARPAPAGDGAAARETLILAGGPPPLGLTALGPAGQKRWQAATVRTTFDLAVPPPGALAAAAVYAIADDGMITGLAADGTAVSAWRLRLGPEQSVLVPTGLLPFTSAQGPALLVSGRLSPPTGEQPTWVWLGYDGVVVAAGPLPALPEFGRAHPVAVARPDSPTDLLAFPTAGNQLHWLRPGDTEPVSEPLDLPALCLATGPDPDGRTGLLAGTATGVVELAGP